VGAETVGYVGVLTDVDVGFAVPTGGPDLWNPKTSIATTKPRNKKIIIFSMSFMLLPHISRVVKLIVRCC